MKKIVSILVGLTLSACTFGSGLQSFKFTKVSSVDIIKDGNAINTITIKNDKELIQILDNMREIEDVGSLSKFEWDYKLRLNKSNDKPNSRLLWLYSSKTGKLIRLTKAKTPLYQIKDFATFNERLGIIGH